MAKVNWEVFTGDPEHTCRCRCGVTYRSHSKYVARENHTGGVITRKSCPGCGRNDNCKQITFDPEICILKNFREKSRK